MTPTRQLVEEVRALDKAATPGPWRVVRKDEDAGDITYGVVPTQNEGATVAWVPEDCNDNASRDAAFIARVRTLLPQLADALARAEAELAALSLAAMDADLYCWGPAYDAVKAQECARRLRGLSQPNENRSNAAWVLLDRLRQAEARIEAMSAVVEAAQAHIESGSTEDWYRPRDALTALSRLAATESTEAKEPAK